MSPDDRNDDGASLGARKRRAVQEHVSAVGTELFLRNGFDAVTVDAIAAAAGISRTSFFRYFSSKEDVALVGAVSLGRRVRATLVNRPANELAWDALRHALVEVPAAFIGDPDRGLAQARLVMQTPSIRARNADKYRAWTELLTPDTARRLGVDYRDPTEPRPRAVVAAALACLDTATEIWVEADGNVELSHLIEKAMAPMLHNDVTASDNPSIE